ncbi:zinc ribbon domain-containing protein [Streptomyces sp. GMY01]|uniref:NADase-type glycan-binding domain-containing protein n=1 Tax=Streptomyces sp. GMY02 TaxID=1333528 RepID=UPI00146D16BE|nr:zinc ribbon domain-containing protein [Streptomyces sp. GMY02]NMO32626.1 zinc ribbon domain-containing protein [Streptomyces sp. GMY02]
MTTTQNCADCGTRAEPGQSFCDACGAVLSWTDRSAAPRAAAGATAGAAAGTPGPAEVSGSADASGPAGTPRSAGGRAADGTVAAAGASGASVTTGAPVTGGTATADAGPGGSGGSDSSDGSGGFGGSGGPAGAHAAFPGAGAGATGGPSATAAATGGTPPRPTATAADGEPGSAPDPAPRHNDDDAATPASHPAQGAPTPGAPAPGTSPSADTVPQPPVPASGAPAPAVDENDPTTPLPTTQAPGAGEGMTDRARQLLIPVADPQPQAAPSPSVAPVLPGRPVAQRPQTVRAPGEELGADGGTPCPWCQTRNRPDRHYCTRCAMPMAGGGQTPGRLPWWRRLTAAGNREAPWAGDRPRLRRAFDRVLAWLVAAVVLTLLIVLAVHIPQGVQATRDHFAKRAPVAPDRVTASRSYPGHKPDLAFDKLSNTWWGPGVSESGQGQWIEARFSEPTRLLDLIITPGVSTRPDQLSQSALPHRVEALITLADGKKTKRELVLDQGAGGQRRAFRVGKVSAVRFILETAYQPSASKQVSIAEIEFFGPSNGN